MKIEVRLFGAFREFEPTALVQLELPDGAPSGFGSAADFRRLLTVHPRPAKPPPPAKPRSDQDQAPSPREPKHIAAARVGPAGTGSSGSTLPIVAGILVLAGGLAAVAHAARDGRA